MAASSSPARISRFIEHTSRPSSPIPSFTSDTPSAPQPPPLSTSTSTSSIITISGPSTPIQQKPSTPLRSKTTIAPITPTPIIISDSISPTDAGLTLEQCLAEQRAWEDKRISLASTLAFDLEIIRIDDAEYVVPVRPSPRSLASSGSVRPIPKTRLSSASTTTLAPKTSELNVRRTRPAKPSARPFSFAEGLESVPYEQTQTQTQTQTPEASPTNTASTARRFSSMSAYALPTAIPEELQVAERRVVSDPVRSSAVSRQGSVLQPKRTGSIMRRFSTKIKMTPPTVAATDAEQILKTEGELQVPQEDGTRKKRLSRLAFWR